MHMAISIQLQAKLKLTCMYPAIHSVVYHHEPKSLTHSVTAIP